MVMLTQECIDAIKNTCPPKLKDLCKFTLECTIDNLVLKNALCDFEVSVNLISLSLVKKLGLGDVLKRTEITIQLVDWSIRKP